MAGYEPDTTWDKARSVGANRLAAGATRDFHTWLSPSEAHLQLSAKVLRGHCARVPLAITSDG